VDWEEEMKRLLMVLVAGLLIASITAPALAWEFAMNGEAEWRYRYFARTGGADLFGNQNLAVGTASGATIGFAGPVNNAVLVQGFSAKGADAATAEQRFWFYPEIRINPAVRMRGEYWVTGTNLFGVYDGNGLTATANPADNWFTNRGYNGWYFNNGQTGVPAGMSVGLWEKFWVTAQTPWGILAFGRRPFAFGLGWSGLHEKDADTDSIVFAVPYGPLTFIIGPSSVYGTPGDNIVPNSTPIVGVTAANGQIVDPTNGAKGTDKNRYRAMHFAAAFTYRNGPVDTGIFATWTFNNNGHNTAQPAGPAGRDDNNAGFATTIGGLGTNGLFPMYGDANSILVVNYFKYFNGRFFFNAEYDFTYGDIRRKGGRPLSIWSDAWMLELGSVCGPAKVTLAAFYSSGQDRRNGLSNPAAADGGGTAGTTAFGTYDRVTAFAAAAGRYEAIKPYVWLLGIYGGGNNSFDNRGLPMYADWLSYAARLDYAVAANLNVWGSYIYARRASNTATGLAAFNGGALAGAGRPVVTLGGGRSPNVPDDYLGWEADVGVNWKLLEGLTFNARGAWWQPGNWFKYAYVDYTDFNTVNIGGMAAPINPNRTIDPIIGFEGSLLVEF